MNFNKSKIAIVIPARLNSERFSNKLLSKYNGDTVIGHVLNNANAAKNLLLSHGIKNIDIFLATDEYDKELKRYTDEYNIEYFYSKEKVYCGSERLKLVYNAYSKYDYYISVASDEPALDSFELYKMIITAIENKDKNTVYTAYCNFYEEDDLIDNRSCKIVTIHENIVAYTSRSVVPGAKKDQMHDLGVYKKHVGVFIFPKNVLKNYRLSIWCQLDLNPKKNAALEGLEQNMFIGKEFDFRALKIKHIGFGVDTPDQLQKLEERINK